MASDNVVDVLIFFLSGDKIVDLYNKIYIPNGYKIPFYIASGKHEYGAYKNGTGMIYVGMKNEEGVTGQNANQDFKTIISNFWMLVPEMKIKFDDNSKLSQLSNKMNLLIDASSLKTVENDIDHFNDDIIVSPNVELPEGSKYKRAPENGELYTDKGIIYYSDDKLYNNMQYFIEPDKDNNFSTIEFKYIQPSITKNTNINPCNITCKFINIDILQQNNIDQYTQLFSSGNITKVFIGDDFFDKPINNQILSNLLNTQQTLNEQQNNNTPEVILLPCLYKENSTNKCDDNGKISAVCEKFKFNDKDKEINTELYTDFYGDDNVRKSATYDYYYNYKKRHHCRDNTIIGIVLDNFYSDSNVQVSGSGGRRIKKSTRKTKKTKKTKKPRKKSRKSRKQKKSRKH